MPNLGAVRRERFLTIDNPLNPPGVGWVIFVKVRVSIRTCVQNLGAVRRERFLTIDNPLNPPGVGVGQHFFKGETIYPHIRAKFGRGAVRRPCRKNARLHFRPNEHVYERTRVRTNDI